MKGVQRELTNLSTRISDRPMGLEKSTDFIVYSTQALEHELLSGLPKFIEDLDLSVDPQSPVDLSRTLTVIKRNLSTYIRPIVRKHQRFASRFPTVGGNLGAFFVLSSPGEDILHGETEASLRSSSNQKFSEALLAMIINNLEFRELEDEQPVEESNVTGQHDIIDRALYLHLTRNSVRTATTILRDQMLDKLKVNSTETEPLNQSL